MRLELTQPTGHYPLKVARLPIPPPGHFLFQLSFRGLFLFDDAKLLLISDSTKFFLYFFSKNL